MIDRILRKRIVSDLYSPKVQVIFGPRQIGKTTLLESVFEQYEGKKLWLSADDADVREMLDNANGTRLKQLFGTYNLLVIDEVQRIENAGLLLKIMADQIKPLHVMATGSSAFALRDKISESMAGRAYEYSLFPFWMQELVDHTNIFEEKRLLEHRLIYGYYPEVVNHPGQEKRILQQICDSHLYKDIFALPQVKKPYLLEKLLQAIALQLGSEVSFNELGRLVGADKETVERYIFMLEQAYVIYRLPSFSRNLRNEINKGRKIYFYDNGIRNSIINNFAPLNLRTDKGALWENFLLTERLKKVSYGQIYCNRYFWRTRQQQEIDYIEDYDGILHSFEIKFSPETRTKIPLTFSKAYPNHSFSVVNSKNYEAFVMGSV